MAAPPARGRGDLRTGRDPPRPRALSRAQGGHRTPRASGRRAPGRTPRPGARGPFRGHVLAKHLTLRAPEARCGSQVSITWTQLTATVPGSAGSVGSAGSAGSATPSQALGRSQVSTARFPPAELIRNSNARPCTSASGGGGVDTRGRETRLARERARTPGPRASSPCGPAVSTATLWPPRTEVATRRGPPLRTREPALPGALRAAL